MSLEISLLFIILFSGAFSYLAWRLNFSAVIGLIIAGTLLTLPPLENWIIAGYESLFEALANWGLFTLMFLAGFEVSWNHVKKERRHAVVITASTMATSFLLGVAVLRLAGFSLEAAMICGICFGITAEATKARVLIQLKKLKTRLGSLLMGTGIINDAAGVLLLVVFTYVFTDSLEIREVEILAGILIAFFLGVLTHYKFDRYSRRIKTVENVLLLTLVPFFFVNLGRHFDFQALSLDWRILPIVLLTAALGQILGVLLTKPITKLEWKKLVLIGWGMNSKGAVELAIAYIAVRIGILPPSLYSALVLTALVSTILFQLIIFHMVKANPRIMR